MSGKKVTSADNQQETLYYFSGFLAGEGSISIIKANNTKGRSGYYYTTDITISNADKSLLKEMNRQAKFLNFENALVLKNQIKAIDYLTQPVNKIEEYLENPNLLSDLKDQELRDLAKTLGLPKSPERIESFDISNILGKNSSGSMSVLTKGLPDIDQYRRFRIKTVQGADDYSSLQEVLTRRFKNDWPLPDLIIIDGGKGQLSAALEVLNDLKVNTPLIALAKKHEEIFLPDNKEPLRLSKDNKSLHLLQIARDEAHRFALKYHQKLRNKSFFDI